MSQGLLLSENCSTCFGFHYHPSSGAQNHCNYSIWKPLHCTVVYCYCGRVGTGLNVLWVAYATHNTLKPVSLSFLLSFLMEYVTDFREILTENFYENLQENITLVIM
jgi:hypothetical protein